MGSIRLLVQEAAFFSDQTLLRRQDRPLLLLARLLHEDARPAGHRRTTRLPLRSRNSQIGTKLSDVNQTLIKL